VAHCFATVAIPFAPMPATPAKVPWREINLRTVGYRGRRWRNPAKALDAQAKEDLATRVREVERLLSQMGEDVFEYRAWQNEADPEPAAPNDTLCRDLDETNLIHFMSINVIQEPLPEKAQLPVEQTLPEKAHLLIEVTADGDVDEALREVARLLGKRLETILALVDPGGRPDPSGELLTRLNRSVGQGWFASALGLAFDGSPGMSVRRLRMEQKLAGRIAAMGIISCHQRTPRQKLEEVRRVLWQDDAAKWAFVPEPTPMLDPPLNPGGSTLISARQLIGFFLPAVRTLLWPLAVSMLLLWLLFGWLFGSLGWLGALFLGLLAMAICSACFIALTVISARRHLNRLEETDPAPDRAPDPARVGEMMRREGRCAQGLLASVSTMKSGRFGGLFRRLALRAAFWFIAESTLREAQPGCLGPISDIHFARWFLLPGSDKLFFWSNYDGAWESYIEDFIQLGHQGVSAIWSNTVDFPRTQDLFQGGASDGDRLRRWSRRQMYPPQFWYSAYPDLTLLRIRYNAAIRRGVASARGDADAERWLSLFGSAPAPAPVPSGDSPPPSAPIRPASAIPQPLPRLDKREIPTLLFGGRRHMPHAACLVITMADEPDLCRQWLRRIEPHITYGEDRITYGPDRSRDWALAFALSSTGLGKFGLPEADLNTFPAVFRNGMAASWRSAALGDVGSNAPARWKWANKLEGIEAIANGRNPPQADAALLIYARSTGELFARHRFLVQLASETGQTIAKAVQLQTLPPPHEPMREPFGFVDGISQPLLRDTPRGRAAHDTNDAVEPGEFILGYTDNSGFYPSTLTVRADLDPHHLLAEYSRTAPGPAPAFMRAGSDGRRDFGRNGTFLVIRQLEQNVTGFNAWLDRAADQADPLLCAQEPDRELRRELIAAKLMGRWRVNGSSLLRHPERPSGQSANKASDNGFLLGREDPQGLRCPFGSHIRRANPRDSLDLDDPAAALAIANRHRILRVSRPYEPLHGPPEPNADVQPGTLFMCLNADIERQFEFIQQSYLSARNIQGLEAEVDPVVGRRAGRAPDPGGFTIPTIDGPAQLRGLPDFVRVRGGGYFFMPARRSVRFLATSR
jgi:deferrochelatase/peroxidase EfeB